MLGLRKGNQGNDDSENNNICLVLNYLDIDVSNWFNYIRKIYRLDEYTMTAIALAIMIYTICTYPNINLSH